MSIPGVLARKHITTALKTGNSQSTPPSHAIPNPPNAARMWPVARIAVMPFMYDQKLRVMRLPLRYCGEYVLKLSYVGGAGSVITPCCVADHFERDH